MGHLQRKSGHLARTSGGHLAKCENCDCDTGPTPGCLRCLRGDHDPIAQPDCTITINSNCAGLWFGNPFGNVAGTYVIPCGSTVHYCNDANNSVLSLSFSYFVSGVIRWRATAIIHNNSGPGFAEKPFACTTLGSAATWTWDWHVAYHLDYGYEVETCDPSCDDQFEFSGLACASGSPDATAINNTGSCSTVTATASI